MPAFGGIPGMGRGPSEGARAATMSQQLNERARPTGGGRMVKESWKRRRVCCAEARCPVMGTLNPTWPTLTSR